MKSERDQLKQESTEIKNKLKKLMDISPLVIAGKKLLQLKEQLEFEQNANSNSLDKKILVEELNSFSSILLKKLEALNIDSNTKAKVKEVLKQTVSEKEITNQTIASGKVLLDFTTEQFRNFEAVFNNIKGAFLSQFNSLVQEEKNNRIYLSKIYQQIKQAEARKDNPLAKKLREEKKEAEDKITVLTLNKGKLIEEYNGLNTRLTSTRKVLSEYEKNFKLVETDQKKFEVTEKLLEKINTIIQKIKEDKKFSLQKSFSPSEKEKVLNKGMPKILKLSIIFILFPFSYQCLYMKLEKKRFLVSIIEGPFSRCLVPFLYHS
jgi:DNA sulfur modification protein DndD